MRQGRVQRDTLIVLATAAALQLILFAYDAAMKFYPIVHGDRSQLRWSALHALRGADPSSLMDTLTASQTVPGEYVFAYAAYALGGPAAIIVLQMVLFLLSLACVCAMAATFPWKNSVLVFGIGYAILPHNLAFTHQLVTEAIATPFVVFFIYFYFRFCRSRLVSDALLAGLMLGVAIFVRPPLLLIAPALIAMHVLYRRYFWVGATRAAALLACIALLPMAVWTAAFTSHTGHFGYTSGVANFAWNLRSKVYLVHARNGLEQPEALKRFSTYGDLYSDSAGISVGEFLGYASEHPLLFAQAAASDALIFLARGDASKVLVDHLGLGGNASFKDWRVMWSERGTAGLIEWGLSNADVTLVIVAETLLSLLTLACTLAAVAFCGWCLIRPREVADVIGDDSFAVVLMLTALLAAVFCSAQIVDQAQGRLRHPAEAGLMLLLGYAALYLQRTRARIGGHVEA